MDFPTKEDVAREIAAKTGCSLPEAMTALDHYSAGIDREFLYGSDPMDVSRQRGVMIVTGASVGKTVTNFTHASGSVDFLGEHGGQRFAPVHYDFREGPARSKHGEARAIRGYHKRKKRKARR